MSRLIDAWNALRGKAQRSPDKWEGATVTVADMSAGRSRTRGEPELVARASRVTEWVAICRRLNAQNCAKEPLRLFVTANESGSKWRGKRAIEWQGKTYRRDLCTRKLTRLERKALASRCSRKAVTWTERAGDVEEVMEHPALDLLRRPNHLHSGFEFDELQFDGLEVFGNAFYHLVVGQGGMPTSLWPMSPLYTKVVPDLDGLVGGYWYGRDGTIIEEFSEDEVHHFRFRLSHSDPYYGEGPLCDVIDSQDIWQSAHRGEKAMMDNSARPDYALEAPPNWSPEQAKELQRHIESTFRGQHRRGRILVTTGTKPVPLQFSPREMEYLAGKQDLRTTILAAFGMPESMIQLNDANLASSATGHRQYQEFTIWPRLCKRADDLTEMLLPLYGFEPGEAGLVYDSPVKSDEAARATRNVQLVGAGIMTINEARAEEGLDPDDDGDVLRISGQELGRIGGAFSPVAFAPLPQLPPAGGFGRPADEAPDTPEAIAAGVDKVQEAGLNGAQVTALQGLLQSVSDGLQSPEVVVELVLQAFPAMDEERVRRMVEAAASFERARPEQPAAPAGSEDGDATDAEGAERDGDGGRGKGAGGGGAGRPSPCDCETGSHEHSDSDAGQVGGGSDVRAKDRFTDDLQSALNRWYGDFLARVNGDGELPAGALESLRNALRPAVEAAFLNGRLAGASSAGGDTDAFSVIPQRAIEAIDRLTGTLAGDILGTETDRARQIIAEGLERGDTLRDSILRIREGDGGGYSGARAEAIARTETAAAQTLGQTDAWGELGVKKLWQLSPNPCPICKAIAEKYNRAVEANEPFFKVGDSIETSEGTHTFKFRDVQGPPGHPNCRCALVPEV